MPRGLRVPKLPNFGAARSESPPPTPVRVKATSVHGIPIELRVNPAAQSFTRPFSYDPPRRPSFAAFARALDPSSDGLTVEVEAFCAPAAPVRAPNVGLIPKVPTPNPLPDRVAPSGTAPAPVAPPVPSVPDSTVPPPASAAPPPTLEELAALAEIRDSASVPRVAPSGEAPFPPPPSGKEAAPAPPPAPPKGAALSYAHDVFDRMAPPMAMTFDVGDVSLQRRFSQMDSRLDREARRVRSASRSPNDRAAAASIDDHSLAQDLAAMRWSMPFHHAAGSTDVKAGPAPAVPEAPAVKTAAPVVEVVVGQAPARETVSAPSPTTTAQVVDPAALIAGDVIVASEAARNGAAPVTHTLLFLGDGQVVEAASATGMAVRPLTQVLAGLECALALRSNPGAWSANAGDQPSVLVYIGHLKAPATK
jgi:hypothetical protein